MNSTDLLKILGIEVDQNEVTEVPRAKKRRLDHLTWDEKIQRKKLKNRVAAQTSRDRKKARIEQMESAITELCTRNETLMSQCENLKNMNEKLSLENAELKARLMEPCLSCKQNRSVGPESDEGSSESLLLPMGSNTGPAAVLSKTQTFLKIALVCLLYRNCLMNSTETSTLNHWSNLQRASLKISPKTWKMLLRKQIVKYQNLMKVQDREVPVQWWGKHQKNWNPLEVLC
ncbi:X-box-binding protein 1 [Coccinella septempunctata]|uniref:X-box-binding protein 1 n=1 Tax=Coccinella septempunctata TaxID=41139 RepID=UPI001D092288|nr:X-box-binding protein 1 [Coccinella septempunctata]